MICYVIKHMICCYITHDYVMLYNTCYITHVITHDMLCYITHNMLCYKHMICYVI